MPPAAASPRFAHRHRSLTAPARGPDNAGMSLVPPDFLAPLLRRPVAVFGGGVSGQAVLGLLAALGARSEVYDEQPGVGTADAFTARAARRRPLVVVSPGFAAEHPWLVTARSAGCQCLGELDLAAGFWPGRVVAVTGTNGKTTLTEFLCHALVTAGDDAYAIGNIGFPFCRLVTVRPDAGADATAVCEVSSFQAETLRYFQADATLWTNFAEDHLERHPGMDAYFQAKWSLVERTTPAGLFVGSSVERFARLLGRDLPAAAVATEGVAPDPALAGTVFAAGPQRENFLLARAWWRHEGRPEAELYAAARTFKLGRHRLARVAEQAGVGFWNDSKATNFHAVEAALATFERPVQLIAGGRAKGGDLAGFVRRIAPRVAHAWLIGETRGVLAAFCTMQAVPHTVCGSLAEAVRGAGATARPGDQVVLSPGFASFDMFRGFADRGDQFEKLVNNLAAPATFQ